MLVRELRRRQVIRVAVVYASAAFVILQLGEILVEPFGLGDWALRLVLFLLVLGFPLAIGLAWVYNITEEGVVREVGEEAALEGAPSGSPLTSNGLIVGLLIIAIGLLVYPRVFSSGEGSDNQSSAADTTQIDERSIAVLPFEVSGAGAEDWRDGMVTALTLNLDGAAGLRAISDRAVFAAWKKRVQVEEGLSPEAALEVAREVGARYALVGSAVQLGGDLRFAADIYETSSGGQVDQVEVRGSPDSVTALTNQLTRDVLGILLEKSEDRVPSVDLASITTESLEALKAYLAGERHLRAGAYEAAAEDFETAVRRDSTFALAYARLGITRSWLPEYEAASRALGRAVELSGQLPERERRIIEGSHLRLVQDYHFAAARRFRRLSETYPDDPTVWYELGEAIAHGYIPGGWREADDAFQRAVRLDPGFAQYHHHLVQAAIVAHRDSTLAARRIRAHPASGYKQALRLAHKLVFGSPEQRHEVLVRLDTFRTEAGTLWPIYGSLYHPTDGALQEKVLLRLKEREDLENSEVKAINHELIMNSFERGQVEKATAQLQELELLGIYGSCRPAWSETLGLGVPNSTLLGRLNPDKIKEGASARRLMCAGLYLVENHRSEELPALIRRMRKAGAEQGLSKGELQRQINELKGYRAFRAGNLKRAERFLGRHNESERAGAIWRGDLYRELGQLEKSEGWYQAGWWHAVAQERLGQLYEEMGRPEKAAAAYERFVTAWEDADFGLQPRVETARERLAALDEKKSAE